MNTVDRTGYKSIVDNLIKLGFDHNDNIFSKEDKRTQRIIINGQQTEQSHSFKMTIRYEGEGYIENVDGSNHEELFGFCVSASDYPDETTYWVRDWDDLRSFFQQF